MLPCHGHTGSSNWPPYWGVLWCCRVGKLPAGPVRWYSIQLIALTPMLLSLLYPTLACSLLFVPLLPMAFFSPIFTIAASSHSQTLLSQLLFFKSHIRHIHTAHNPSRHITFFLFFKKSPHFLFFTWSLQSNTFSILKYITLSQSSSVSGHPRAKTRTPTQSQSVFSSPQEDVTADLL